MEKSLNPWKLATIGIALVVCSSALTAIVVTNWPARRASLGEDAASASPATQGEARLAATSPSTTAPASTTPVPAVSPTPAAEPRPTPGVPSQATVDACNRYAAGHGGKTSHTVEVLKDGAIGVAVGAAVGAAGGAIAGGGQGAGKGAAIGGLVGAGGGALYGLNENKKNDERYRQAYASCLRSRGHAS